jgi:hypothetical protein
MKERGRNQQLSSVTKMYKAPSTASNSTATLQTVLYHVPNTGSLLAP